MNDPPPEDNLVSRIEQERRAAAKQAQTTLKSLCPSLAEQGIQEIRIAYDGFGDSGVIEHITASGEGQERTLDKALREELEDAACDLLPAGWEIEDGSSGELVIDVKNRRVERQHNWRLTRIEYEEDSWPL